jgi:UDP-N-acetylmuramyl tripeptide synthase
VLRDPAVQAAVLETARGGLLRRGLAVSHADVAVVTNVSADHLGEYGIAGVDDIAEVKLTLARVLGPQGTLVLNAGDEVLMQAAARLPFVRAVPQAWFSLDDEHPRLRAHRKQGGATCGVRGGRLLLNVGGHQHSLGEVTAMPLALGGAAAYNLENIAAAALAAHAAGLSLPTIEATLASFGALPGDNPGRLERWPYRGATVLVDYAHNPDGLQQLLRVARALKPARLGLLLGQAGNRDDAAIGDLASTAAAFAPDRLVVKELPAMLRGRSLGDVPRLLRTALLAAGLPEHALVDEADEFLAAAALLDWARPGDVIVLPVHTDAVRQRLAALLAAA